MAAAPPRRPWIRVAAGVAVAALMLGATDTLARQRRMGVSNRFPIPTEDSFDGGFHFCRVAFQTGRFRRGGSWVVDYPRADVNLSIRLSELTKTRVTFDGNHEPRHFVLQLTDPTLFRCPFIMMTEPGGLVFDDTEVARLREYLLKGGFLWADDFWGEIAWENFEHEMRRVLPAEAFPLRDLDRDHPLFNAQFPVQEVIQIPSINFWAGTGGGTSEWGPESAVPHARGFLDKDGRVLVLATHNTDYGDAFEREGDDPDYFQTFSIDGYAFGINVLVYAMTH
ncbi:MAG: DUF4159 domain-containing protein [Vicinamibacterales bacterium]